MKRITVILVAIFALLTASAQDTLYWDMANAAYGDASYSEAIDNYEALIERGEESWEVYYNLGAAYFKAGDIGRAILNTERAARLSPANDDVTHNLQVLNAHTKDRIETLPEFFLVEWATTMRDSLKPDSWTMAMLVFVALTLLCGVMWVLRKGRKFMAYGIVFLVLALSAYGFSHSSYARVMGGDDAIVLNTAAVVRSSPEATGKEIFVLHQGTKVEVQNEYGNYTEVTIASGNKGWIATKDIEMI